MARDKEPQPGGDEEPQEPLFTDKRRVDPETGDVRPEAADAASDELSEDDMALLQEAERDLVAEYRDRAARAEAELQNFRTRVERDRQANREIVIAEVIRSLLPVMDDLDRAEAHGDWRGHLWNWWHKNCAPVLSVMTSSRWVRSETPLILPSTRPWCAFLKRERRGKQLLRSSKVDTPSVSVSSVPPKLR